MSSICSAQIKPSEFISNLDTIKTYTLGLIKEVNRVFINEVDKSSKIANDSLFAEVSTLINRVEQSLNKTLYKDPKYEKYETILYLDSSLHDPEAKRFEHLVRSNGFRISSTEGYIFIERNPEYISQIYSPYLTDEMKEFLREVSIEIDNPFQNDAGIIIEMSEFLRRIRFWELFKQINPNFILYQDAKKKYHYYLYYCLSGMDNTPAFNYHSDNSLKKEFKKLYVTYINEYPYSETSVLLKNYLATLKASGFKYDQKVKSFQSKYYPY